MGVKWVTGDPPVSRGNGSQMCVRGQRNAGTRHSPSPASPVPQPLCRNRGVLAAPGATSAGVPLCFVGVGGGFATPLLPPVRRGGVGPGRSGRAERGGPVGARLAAEPRRGQHDRTVPLLSALGTARRARTVGVPGGTGEERDSSAVGPGSGVSERGWSRERAVDGAGCGGNGEDRDGAGSVCTEMGGLGAGETRRAGPGPALGEPGPSGHRQGWPDTGTGLGGPGRGWEDRNGSGTGRSPGDWVEQSGTQPGKGAAVGTRLGGARRGDRLGWGRGHWSGRGVSAEAVWGWGGWELMPHDTQPAALAGGHCDSPVRGSAAPLEGTGQSGGNTVCTGCWGSAPTACHQGELGPGTQRDARHWVGLSPQDWTQAFWCPPPTSALQPQGNWMSQFPPTAPLCSAGQ